MPELPEVETTVRELRKKVLNRAFVGIWTDFPGVVKKPKKFDDFKKVVLNKKIKEIFRKGKNILFNFEDGTVMLVHQKMTGHFLFGRWGKTGEGWKSEIPGPLKDDPANRFLHLIFWLDNGWMVALSDLRKFAKVLAGKGEILRELDGLGPDPLEKTFTFKKFKSVLAGKKGKIKQILMDQGVVSGIGNIYSDEILWDTKINPFEAVQELTDAEIKAIYRSTRKILPLAIKLKGESFSDYRTPFGEKGNFDSIKKVYRREGKECFRCGKTILRKKIGGRSAHYCPNCQKT